MELVLTQARPTEEAVFRIAVFPMSTTTKCLGKYFQLGLVPSHNGLSMPSPAWDVRNYSPVLAFGVPAASFAIKLRRRQQTK
ncbi:hypothetical protein E4U55_004436 [Claviceps digitariae]|nr:hypothetical protein E4U55_004436 [Claviceps digitariae]